MTEADRLVAHISGAKKFVVKNSGHALTVQSPDIFESKVLRFLAE
jgi:pimeloyl-ACP methyl ester carboxylesterase